VSTSRWSVRSAVLGLLVLGCKADEKAPFSPAPIPPYIFVSPDTVSFIAQLGSADPSPKTFQVKNLGGGDLSALSVSLINYGVGQQAGWLTASLSGSPAILTVQPSLNGLPAGNYSAVVVVSDPTASNGSFGVGVSLRLTDFPAISLSGTQIRFSATPTAPHPPPQQVTITNSAGSNLVNLSVGTISYGAGEPTGWVGTSLSSTTAPSTLTITANIAPLAAGTYSASVPVVDPAASNTPQNISITATVSAGPVIAVTPGSRSFSGVAGGTNPPPQSVNITNGGGGTLPALALGPVAYGFGATSWLTATLSSPTAPATINLQVNTAGVAPGSYLASVPITTPSDTTIVGQSVIVALDLVAPPRIVLSQSVVNFNGLQGGTNPAAQSILISNGGTGTLGGLGVASVTYSAGATGWLTTTLNSTTVPATIRLSPNITGISAGNYSATVQLVSSTAGVTPVTLTVNLAIGAVVPGSIVLLNGNNQTAVIGSVLATALVARVYDNLGNPLQGASVTWLAVNGSLSNTTTTTDALGQVSSTWQLGLTAGTQSVQVQTPGVPSKVFTATATTVPSAGYPNEPPGFTKITERGFDARIEDNWTDRPGQNFIIFPDASVPRSQPNTGRAQFPLGFQGGSGPISTGRSLGGNYKEIYISFWIRFSSNWDGHTAYVNKIWHIWINGVNRVYVTSQGVNAGPMQPQINLQQVNENPVSRNLTPNITHSQLMTRGQWHRWEIVLRANTPGQPDGRADWWVDGVQVGSYAGINYIVAGGNPRWTDVVWNPTWGGVGDVVPATQFMDIDHVYISGK
jgi:hypothetical protein